MPWKETSVSNLRAEFIGLYRTGSHPLTDLCKFFGISRVTAYKLIKDFNEHGQAALLDKPRAPRNHPNATPTEIEERIKECKSKHPKWGPKKLKAYLSRQDHEISWPATSTFGEILKRSGLTVTRRRLNPKRLVIPTGPLSDSSPNSTWCADFKGQFTLGNGQWCYPLTISDACSRMLLRCHCLSNTATAGVKPVFLGAFMEYGLPEAIRTDNGTPFTGSGIGGLTPLAIWWVRLGIRLDRTQKGHPEQNGRHERMHRELKACVITPPEYDMNSQQRAFDKFQDEYNNERPHEALSMDTPASRYAPSAREYPAILPEIEYPEGIIIRKVHTDGCIRWKSRSHYVCDALQGEPLGLDRLDERHLVIYYGPMAIGVLDDSTGQLLGKREASEMLKLHQMEGHYLPAYIT